MKISSHRHLLRRDRLEQLVKEVGSATRLATEAKTPKTHISALLAGNRGLGDKLAAKFERAVGRPGWFDAPSDAAMPFRDLSPIEAMLVAYFRELPPQRQAELVMSLRAKPAAPEPIHSSDRPPAYGAQIPPPARNSNKKRA